MKHALLAALVLSLCATAGADEIRLVNGRKITGKVTSQKDGLIVVEVGAGTVTFRESDVSSIDPGRTPLDEYPGRFEKIKDSKKASDFWSLAEWAKGQKLTRYVSALARRVIELEPDHAAARKQLGYEKIDGKWLTYEEAQAAKGLVWTGSRWSTEAEIALMEQRRIDAETRRREQAKEREERAAQELARREAMAQAYMARMDHDLSQLDGYFYSPSFAFTTPYFRPYWHAPYLRSRRYYQEGWKYNGGGYGTFDLFRFIPDPFLKTK